MGKTVRGFGWVVGFGVLAAAVLAAAEPVRIVGSDLLGAEFSAAVYAGTAGTGRPVVLALDGSRPGVERLRSGWADVGLLNLPAGEAEALTEFAVETIAFQVVRVVAAAANPRREIARAQLAAIFGGAGPMPRTWAAAGLEEAGGERPLTAWAPETGLGVGLELFRHVVLGGSPLRSQVVRYRDVEELTAEAARDPGVIGIVTSPPVGGPLRVLAVAERPGQPAVEPTPETLRAGKYGMSLPLTLVVRRTRAGELAAVTAWFRSPEAARALTRAGLTAVYGATEPRAKAGREGSPADERNGRK
jgi:ABC-type phosphate transport system substrate-binding protein